MLALQVRTSRPPALSAARHHIRNARMRDSDCRSQWTRHWRGGLECSRYGTRRCVERSGARILIFGSDWVLNHARNQIIHTFQQLKAARYQAHVAYLQTIPCYTLYQTYNGRPPLLPAQIAVLHGQINQANQIFKQGIDDDWRRSCLQYPEVLDYFFSLVELSLPDERDVAVMQPRFGGTPVKEPKRVTQRRSSTDESSVKTKKKDREKDRRRDSGRTPPAAPMAGGYRR